MARTRTIILLVLGLFVRIYSLNAQEENIYPNINEQCPNFIIRNLEYFPKKEASLEDFKGKWLILDFWNQYCGACISSFPKINNLQRQFRDKVQFVLVGYAGSQFSGKPDNVTIRKLYAKVKEREQLQLTVTFDSLLFQRFDVGSSPHLIIIDDKGVVKAITTSVEAEDLSGLIEGKNVLLPKTYFRWHDQRLENNEGYNDSVAFLEKTDTSSVICNSVLEDYKGNMTKLPRSIDAYINQFKFVAIGSPLLWLYKYAYFGKPMLNFDDTLYGHFSDHIALVIKDTSIFQYDIEKGKNLFTCLINLPPDFSTSDNLKTALQNLLESSFNYQAVIEEKTLPCLRLVVANSKFKTLMTKGGISSVSSLMSHFDIKVTNMPIRSLIRILWGNNPSLPPIIDDTGIKQNIDISLNCFLNDYSEIKKELQRNGLDIIQSEKPMKVLVIRDRDTKE